MGRTREMWEAVVSATGYGHRPEKNADEPYAVTIKAEIPSRDNRMIEISMDADSAESLGRALIENARKVRSANASVRQRRES